MAKRKGSDMAGHHTGERQMALKRLGPHKMAVRGPAKRMAGRMRGKRGVRK